jgi:hypothetical protein
LRCDAILSFSGLFDHRNSAFPHLSRRIGTLFEILPIIFAIFRPLLKQNGYLLRSSCVPGCIPLLLAEIPMIITVTKPLFPWDALEDSPALQSIRTVLQSIPDGKLLVSLRLARGKGRDDYPVHVLWGTLLLAIVLRHVTM